MAERNGWDGVERYEALVEKQRDERRQGRSRLSYGENGRIVSHDPVTGVTKCAITGELLSAPVKGIAGTDENARVELFPSFEGTEMAGDAGQMLGGRDLGTHRTHEFKPDDGRKEPDPIIFGGGLRGSKVWIDEVAAVPQKAWKELAPQPSWMRKHDYEVLFKDSPDYFVVKNARLILAVNGWVVFHVFVGDTFSHQEMYPAHHIHRMKALKIGS